MWNESECVESLAFVCFILINTHAGKKMKIVAVDGTRNISKETIDIFLPWVSIKERNKQSCIETYYNRVCLGVCLCVCVGFFFVGVWLAVASHWPCAATFTHQLRRTANQMNERQILIDRHRARSNEDDADKAINANAHRQNPKSIERFQRVNVSKVSHFDTDYVKTLKCAARARAIERASKRLKVALECAFNIMCFLILMFHRLL